MQINRIDYLTLVQIREWLKTHQRRVRLGDSRITLTEIATRAQVSRQTIYALLRDERSEFGRVAQIRLSKIIVQISTDPAYQHSKLMQVRLTPSGARLGLMNFGLN